MSADEKRNRKNEMARIRRANGKQNSVVDTEMPEPDSVPEPEPELPEPEPMPPTVEEIEMKRKEAISEKRRQSLILARSKITPKNVIRKDAIDKVRVIQVPVQGHYQVQAFLYLLQSFSHSLV